MKIFLRRGLEGPWISAHWSVHGFQQKTSTRCDINNPTLYSGTPFSLKSKWGNPSSNTRMIHYMACLHTLLSFKVTRLFYLSHQMVRFLIYLLLFTQSPPKFSRLFALQLDSVNSFIKCLFVCRYYERFHFMFTLVCMSCLLCFNLISLYHFFLAWYVLCSSRTVNYFKIKIPIMDQPSTVNWPHCLCSTVALRLMHKYYGDGNL